MVTFTVEREIAAPAAAVFDWLVDSSNYTNAPLVLRERRVRDGDGAPYGRGAVREITGVGAWFREEITLYDRPREFRYLILRSLPRIVHQGGSLVFETVAGGTRARWTTSYGMPGAWGGQAAAKLLEPLLRNSFSTLLALADRDLTGAGRGSEERSHTPFAVMNRLVNPTVRAILSSPLHRLLSSRLALITFTGRRSGRSYTIPVLYARERDQVNIPVEWPARKRWWRNLRSEAPVELRLRGQRVRGRACAREQDGSVSVEVHLESAA